MIICGLNWTGPKSFWLVFVFIASRQKNYYPTLIRLTLVMIKKDALNCIQEVFFCFLSLFITV